MVKRFSNLYARKVILYIYGWWMHICRCIYVKGMAIPLGHLGQNLISVWLQGIYNFENVVKRLLLVFDCWTLAWPQYYWGRSSSAKQDLHRWTWGVAFRKVTDGERQGGTGMGQHPEHAVWSEGGKEVLKMCVSALKSACWNFAKFEQNLWKGWNDTGARLLHHPSLVWLVSM